jgi:hypothetical protein
MDRVDEAVSRGDLGSAKRLLLADALSGYDELILVRLAEICWEMRDPVEAGQYWLATSATGPEVDAALEAYRLFNESEVWTREWNDFGECMCEVVAGLERQQERVPSLAVERLSKRGLIRYDEGRGRRVAAATPSRSQALMNGVVGWGIITLIVIVFVAGVVAIIS